jgi:hypothetical protein
MTDLDRIMQELAAAEGWVDVSALAERLNTITASWSALERERAIELFVDGLRERNSYRYER